MVVKALRKKDTKEFIYIEKFGDEYEKFTSSLPNLMSEHVIYEDLIEYYSKSFPNLNFDDCEMVEFDLIEKEKMIKIDIGRIPEEYLETFIKDWVKYSKTNSPLDNPYLRLPDIKCIMLGVKDQIIAFGQEAKIINIDKISEKKYRFILDHPIVVPTSEYTRDYVYFDEIDKIL